MEDSISVKSMESVATSDEYVFVTDKESVKNQQTTPELPKLNIANNGNLEDLQNDLREVLTEDNGDAKIIPAARETKSEGDEDAKFISVARDTKSEGTEDAKIILVSLDTKSEGTEDANIILVSLDTKSESTEDAQIIPSSGRTKSEGAEEAKIFTVSPKTETEGDGEAEIIPVSRKTETKGDGEAEIVPVSRKTKTEGDGEAKIIPSSLKTKTEGDGEAKIVPASRKTKTEGDGEAKIVPASRKTKTEGSGEVKIIPASRKTKTEGSGEVEIIPASRKTKKEVDGEVDIIPASQKTKTEGGGEVEIIHLSRKTKKDSTGNVKIVTVSGKTKTTIIGNFEVVPVERRTKRVGRSKFYGNTRGVSMEKQDVMKPEDYGEEDFLVPTDLQQECTIFNGVTYLGATLVNAPKSESEIQRNMSILNAEQGTKMGIKVSVSIPSSSQGSVVLYDTATQQAITHYEVQRILFFARGDSGGSCAACFGFTWSHGETRESAIHQCHVFRCDIPEAVGQVSTCFLKAFQRIPRSMTNSLTSSDFNGFNPGAEKMNSRVFIFEVSLEIKEEDGKGGYSNVPKDKNCFKLRSNVAKQVCFGIQQVSNKDGGSSLEVERCFGVLVSPGRNVKHSDMRLLEMQINAGAVPQEKQCYNICGRWDPADPALASLNVETPRDTETFMTVAVDLVIRRIREPVRFQIETSVKVYPQNERFWYFAKRNLVQQFYLNSKEMISDDGSELHYEVQSIETSGELDRNRLNLALNLASLIRSPSLTGIDALTPKEEVDSDGDEPMLSGTGEVSKDCSADELASWAEALEAWRVNGHRPKLLVKLTRQGIPEALRCEVWQRLSNCDTSQEMMDKYRMFITKESICESVILRDMSRTFPAHEYFKEAGGVGQDSLYRISKAYAVYDQEVGYCQGLSFLVASLLLHMPEEQAFCLLVRLMYDYGLRDLYKDRFDNLHMRFYQLNRLMEEQLPELYKHFCDRGVETHMFAAQWFLTLFSARFPLYLVFHILDVFLLQGHDVLFQVALALLMLCKKELLQMDFESILKYFRVYLPKRCRNQEVSRHIMKLACSVSVKKLKKYEAEFIAFKEAQENVDAYDNEVQQLRGIVARNEEEKQRLEAELVQVKEMLQREVARADTESRRSVIIIAEYKQICQRLEDDYNAAKTTLGDLRLKMSKCEKCNEAFGDSSRISGESEQSLENRIDPKLHRALERVRELELELAQTKLAHVEAECRNQDLTHQLHATASELQVARNTWPWLSKTLSSIKEAANKREVMTPGVGRRESAPGGEMRHALHSQSRDNLKEFKIV